MVKGREMSKWEKITPDILSEEVNDDGTFIRHRYSWRSSQLNRFVDKREERIAKKSKKKLARKHTYGSVINQSAPPNVQEWMKIGIVQNETSPSEE